MLRVELDGFGGTEVMRLKEAPIPVPKDGEVLIEVKAAGVNRPDLLQRQGKYPPPPGASPILGLEVAGVVSAAGAGTPFKAGDSVCALAPGGGYAQSCLVPSPQCLPLPRGLSLEEAAGIPETFFTVWANVFQTGRLKAGESILIHGGAGGIGTTAIQLARAFGATPYATSASAEKCAACERLGAVLAVNYKEKDFVEEIKRATSGRGVDMVLDIIGGDYTDRNIACLAMDGRLIQLATQAGPVASVNLARLMQKRVLLTGSAMRPRTVEEKGRIAQGLREEVWPLLEGKKVRVVVDRVFPLAQAAAAHTYLESGAHVGKVILRC